MKINWGTGIFIFYSLFVGALVFQLVKSFQYDNSLVVENYYEKDLNYQEQYNKIQNSLSLENPLTIHYKIENKTVTITFPKDIGNAIGQVFFYRANDKSQDVKVAISNSIQSEFEIPVEALQAGEWEVSVDWSADGKPFFNKKIIVI